jgi:hypothetical protein
MAGERDEDERDEEQQQQEEDKSREGREQSQAMNRMTDMPVRVSRRGSSTLECRRAFDRGRERRTKTRESCRTSTRLLTRLVSPPRTQSDPLSPHTHPHNPQETETQLDANKVQQVRRHLQSQRMSRLAAPLCALATRDA